MDERICAIVVTFNRKDLLMECLQGLRAQTRRPDSILVIDNASSDGTAESVREGFPDVQVLRLEENSGGAGGFSRGIKEAFDLGFEWMWVMDDDVEPLPDALEVLCAHRRVADFIHLRRTGPAGPRRWQGVLDLTGPSVLLFGQDVSFQNGMPWIPINYACFEGAFFHRRVVERIGLPDPQFFISGDDFTYGFLASLHTLVIYVNHIGMRRKLPSAAPGTQYRLVYLIARNRFLCRKHVEAAGLPVVPFLFWMRTLHTACSMFSGMIAGRWGWKVPWMNLRGTWDGCRGRFGTPPWIRKKLR